ncbi:hypothetical protein [Pelomonas cellulosilytica]|uniref:Aerotolerance regulator N-terminal domain-containing protein n=1 Tax=Pelomonas cellulosilytica TaxID=2906762 RepID=A0ABS8Y1Q5_9BURK|nr:hypothetical protein [Pelomonas sp. P8]MCE4557945.1 hypothetical protein [Pelomonas sp. P8]
MFSLLPAWLAYAGAVALAAGLFLLQRLRVRPRVVVLPSAMLWRLAAIEAPPRTLYQRFRGWPAYLLSLLLVLLLWSVVVGLQRAPEAALGRHVFYLDNSVLLTPDGRLDRARQALLDDVARVPAAQREVVLGDALGTRLLAPGEPLGLLQTRLQAVAAEIRPSTFAGWARQRPSPGGEPLTLHYYGAWPAAEAARPPAGARLAWGYVAPAVPNNRGIVSLGAWPARSGTWGRVDVLVGTMAQQGAAPDLGQLSFSLDGRPFSADGARAAGPAAWVLRDVVADGRTLRVALRQGDAFAADDAAALVLPRLQRVAVAVGPGVPTAVADVIRHDPSLQRVDEPQAQVVVRAGGEGASAAPALRLVPAASQASAFAVKVPGPTQPDAGATLVALGLSGLEAGPLADRLNRSIGIDLETGPRREIAAWRELFEEGAGFTRDAAMPLFVSRSLHWLATPAPWASHVRAGHAMRWSSPDETSTASNEPAAVGAFVPGAGAAVIDGHTVTASLLDEGQSRAAGLAPPAPVRAEADEARPNGTWAWDAAEVALVLALLLLLVEWQAYRRGRMP